MEKQKTKRILQSILRELGFYFVLVLLILCVFFIKNSSGGAPTTICGFSMMQVLTGSMETEIPQGSLIVTRHVDPASLEVGDDITYMVSSTTTITHRIIEIMETYADTGERAFITQGVCNAEPDKDPVAAVNVVGKVIFHSYVLGQILKFIQQNWIVLLILLVLFVALFHSLKVVFQKENAQETAEETTQEPSNALFSQEDLQDE